MTPYACFALILCSLGWETDAFVPAGQAFRPYGGRVTSKKLQLTERPLLRDRSRLCASEGGSAGDDDRASTSEGPGLVAKAAWYGSELFGNLVGMVKPKEAPLVEETGSTEPLSREDAVERLKGDFDRLYFVTGQMDLDLYEEDCTFVDEFVSFKGRQRFKNNLDNLGSFMQDVGLDVTGWEETESSVKTKWRFRCVLDLPWKPTLAASGGTEFFFSGESGRIERHVESWEIKPMDALKQLVRPGRQIRKT